MVCGALVPWYETAMGIFPHARNHSRRVISEKSVAVAQNWPFGFVKYFWIL